MSGWSSTSRNTHSLCVCQTASWGVTHTHTLPLSFSFSPLCFCLAYTVTDVKDLHEWMVKHFSEHPLFVRVPDSELGSHAHTHTPSLFLFLSSVLLSRIHCDGCERLA